MSVSDVSARRCHRDGLMLWFGSVDPQADMPQEKPDGMFYDLLLRLGACVCVEMADTTGFRDGI